MTVTVLVTGFGPFGEHESNPSEAIAKSLNDTRVGNNALIKGIPITVDSAGLDKACQEHPISIFTIAIGLAASAPCILVERRGKNIAAESKEKAIPNGVEYAESALITYIADLVNDSQHLKFSDDAGDYYCNELYYRLLNQARSALFIHIPAQSCLSMDTARDEILRIIERLVDRL